MYASGGRRTGVARQKTSGAAAAADEGDDATAMLMRLRLRYQQYYTIAVQDALELVCFNLTNEGMRRAAAFSVRLTRGTSARYTADRLSQIYTVTTLRIYS